MPVRCQLTAGHQAPGPIFWKAVSAGRGGRQALRTGAHPAIPAAEARKSGQRGADTEGRGGGGDQRWVPVQLVSEFNQTFLSPAVLTTKTCLSATLMLPVFRECPHLYFQLQLLPALQTWLSSSIGHNWILTPPLTQTRASSSLSACGV